MVTTSGHPVNFVTLSEKPLSFCTDFAHYHPISKWWWRPIVRAIRMMARRYVQEARWKVEAPTVVDVTVVRCRGVETSCHVRARHPKSWCPGR
jgi:hypothetical protein